MENKVAQIQNEASRLSGKQIQVEEEEKIQIQSSSQFKRKSIQQKNKQQKLLIDTPIINFILTNDGVKMNIHKRVMFSYK